MPYLVKLLVGSRDDTALEERVKFVIMKAGGIVRRCEGSRTSADTQELYATFVFGETRILPAIVRAVEAIPGAAVMAVTEPREVGGLKRV